MSTADPFAIFKTDPAEKAAQAQVGGYQTGMDTANRDITQGTNQGIRTLRRSLPQLNQLYNKDMSGYDMYQNSLGLNGDAGNQAASNAFHTQPGYDFLQQQGEQALMRNNAALGGLASGNTVTDLSKFDTGLADQSYKDWQNNLAGFKDSPLNDINSKAAILNNMAGLYANAGNQKAYYGYNGNVGIGNANAGAAMAPYNAAANEWGLGLSALKGVGGLYGMG